MSPTEPRPNDSGPAPVDQLTYERARDELVATVAELESGQASLAQAMALWQRGEALAERCQSLLEDARAAVAAQLGGEPGTEA
ncbi:MAG: exodeoxyribonuclease VII small subunit [Propionibacteriaceae bacterium]|jgi:exodeoxyribonuclease VII small subunit|nr:exodeoxyribonuclease VII small subunit [Propionibacteriaceae bacterium]